VTDREYEMARRRLLSNLSGPEGLLKEAEEVVRRLARTNAFPRSFSPFAEWTDEAASEVFQAWAERRLIARGDLRSIVARAGELWVFRKLCESSLRQFLLNQRASNQAQNIYGRVQQVFETDGAFHCFVEASRKKDRWWGLVGWEEPQPFDENERLLRSAAWSVGSLSVIRYRADAEKLSPVLDRDELRRFVIGVFETVEALLTVAHFVTALRGRLDLDPAPVLTYRDDTEQSIKRGPAEQLALKEAAVLAIASFTGRQARVLMATGEDLPVAEIAKREDCSAGTVVGDRQRAGEIVRSLSGDEVDERELLKMVLDLLYEAVR
jgi:DNA-binding CsgD family transcriptional regulator